MNNPIPKVTYVQQFSPNETNTAFWFLQILMTW